MYSLYLLLWCCSIFSPSAPVDTPLTIQVKLSQRLSSAPVYLVVYTDPENFPDHPEREEYHFHRLPVNGAVTVTMNIEDPGGCVVACFADLNGNAKLDTNWLGIPKEPYAFSGKGTRFAIPSWSRSEVGLNGMATTCTIYLK